MKDFVAEIVAASPYADIYLMPSIIHRRHGVAMSFHHRQPAHEDFLPYFSHISFDQKKAVHISYNSLYDLVIQSSNDRYTNLDNIDEVNNGVWLINGQQDTDLAPMQVFQDWFKTNYRFCTRFLDHDEATIDLFLKPNIPCDALGDQSKYEVLYDNGMRLHNVSYDLDSNRVTFYLVWTTKPERDYAFSIQFFDGQGEKAHQYDKVVRREPVSVHSVDITSLRNGSYVMKLILYDFETGVSQSGTVEKTKQHFERELEIATIEVR